MAYVTDEIPELEPIRDEEWLTQYGRRGPDGSPNFTIVPTNPDLVRPPYLGRQPTANAMSVLRGRKSVEEATRTVCRRRARAGDGVRYAQAGTFRAEDFTVNPDPTPRSPDHSQVANLDISRVWTNDGSKDCDASRFNKCFGEPAWWKETT
jgi:hypothetical protein